MGTCPNYLTVYLLLLHCPRPTVFTLYPPLRSSHEPAGQIIGKPPPLLLHNILWRQLMSSLLTPTPTCPSLPWFWSTPHGLVPGCCFPFRDSHTAHVLYHTDPRPLRLSDIEILTSSDYPRTPTPPNYISASLSRTYPPPPTLTISSSSSLTNGGLSGHRFPYGRKTKTDAIPHTQTILT